MVVIPNCSSVGDTRDFLDVGVDGLEIKDSSSASIQLSCPGDSCVCVVVVVFGVGGFVNN